jgi:hypothetical protein
MEKRIPFFHFQSVKSVAKAIDPYLKTMDKLKGDVLAIKEAYEAKQAKLKAEFEEKATKVKQEYDNCQLQIDSLETGILQMTGFHVAELVKKVIEPTGKTDPKTGKPIKVTKYLPTDIVSYDENTKEYVVTVPDEGEQAAETVVPPTTEDTAGSDYDKDAEVLETHEEESEKEAAEAEAENKPELPWD